MYFPTNKTNGMVEMMTSRTFSVKIDGLVGTDAGWNGATEVVTENEERRLTRQMLLPTRTEQSVGGVGGWNPEVDNVDQGLVNLICV